MQINLPDIKQLLTDWYLLTLENPLYAGALVISAWLITVFFYSIRIFLLNRKQRVADQASIKLQSQLDETLQQNKQSEEKLTEVTEQMAKEQQLATELSAKVEQRNQQIVENIKQLANKFDLSEQLVVSAEKPKAEFVWQQQDNIQMQLTERLQAEKLAKNTLQETYQQERELFARQKALIEQLQKNLDLQTSKSTQLEQDLSAHRLIQQQQINEADQKLADKLADIQAKHELDVASLVNELNQQRGTVGLDAEGKKPVEAEVKDEVSQETISEEASQIQSSVVEPEAKVQEKELTAKIEPEVVVNESVPEVLEPIVTEELLDKVASVAPALVEVQEEGEPDYTKSNMDISGKFKNLFSKDKKRADKSETKQQVEILAAKVSIPELEKVETELDYTKSNLDITGKFKNLFSKEKKQADKKEPKQQTEVLAAKLPVAELEDLIEEEPVYTKSNLDISGKFKNLFAKEKKQAVKTEPERVLKPEPEPVHQTEVVSTAAREPEPEEQAFEPDYSKSNFDLSGKVKKLFGKS